MKSLLLLVANDLGVDLREQDAGNFRISSDAVARLMRSYPHTQLEAARDLSTGYTMLGSGKMSLGNAKAYRTAMPLGRVLAERGLPQKRIYPAQMEQEVTFFFDGQRSTTFPQCDNACMESDQIYDAVADALYQYKYSFILVGFNTPKGGRSGLKQWDDSISKIVEVAVGVGVVTIFVAAESHQGLHVPFVVAHDQIFGINTRLQQGSLSDVAPTILHFLGLPKSKDMSGVNLCQEIHIEE